MSNHLNKLAAEFNRYFTSANGVDVPAKVSVSRDEWRALFTAIQQAEAQQPATGEPVAWMASYVDPVGNDHVYVTSHRDLAVENDMHGEPKPLYTHPAPGVPDDVVRDAERYRWLRKSLPAGQGSLTVLLDDRCNGAFHKAVFMESLDASIDAAMPSAQAQKGQP